MIYVLVTQFAETMSSCLVLDDAAEVVRIGILGLDTVLREIAAAQY